MAKGKKEKQGKTIAYVNRSTNWLQLGLLGSLKKWNKDLDLYFIAGEDAPDRTAPEYELIKLPKRGSKFTVGYIFDYLKSVISRKQVEVTSFLFFKNLKETLDRLDPDVIILNTLVRGFSYQTLNYARKHKKKLILQLQTQQWPKQFINRLFFKMFIWWYRKEIFNYATLTAWTKRGKQFWEQECGHLLKGKKIMLLPAGVSTKKFYPKKKRVFLKNGVLRLLIVARMVGYKRYDDLLEAMKIVKESGKNGGGCKVVLSILGKGPLERSIKNKIKELRIADCVAFLEKLPNDRIREQYQDHDVLVLPSYNESIGMVVPEAMACGTPTITSDTVGANVYVKEGKTGLIFKTGDVKELAGCIQSMCDQKRLVAFGKAAEALIKKEFTVEKVAGKLFREI